MGDRSAGEPGETGIGSDGVVPAWQPVPRCSRCGAAFAAHLDGGCPRAEASRAPRPRDSWLRRHWLLTGAIVLAALLAGIGVGTLTGASPANGNATACSDFWKLQNAGELYATGAGAAGWQDLQAAGHRVTYFPLGSAVDKAVGNASLPGSEPGASIMVGEVCTSLGYGNPG